MLKKTPLNAAHRALNAKLMDFGGWEMPLHYGSQIEEHHRVRREAGMFDVSHMLAVDVVDEGARTFLRQLLANNVDRMQVPGKALYSCMLNDSGGVLDDLIVYFLDPRRFRLVVNAATADKDLGWMSSQRARAAAAVTITPRRELAMIAVQGPAAREKVWRALPQSKPATKALDPFFAAERGALFFGRTGYTGEDGFEIMLPAAEAPVLWQALLDAGVGPAGLGARDTLRLEAGMNLYGQDMDETVTPLECGLKWTVDLESPRDFVGKAALLGAPARAQMLGLVLLERGVLRAHQEVDTRNGRGEITSGSFSPTLDTSIALARLPIGVQPGEPAKVKIRDKWLPARTVKYPFVRNGRSLVAGLSSSFR
ncbi:MAG TPA: glycine cleavage system aminomethyltransferase GcvT [Burkholderiales bacterium]|jgi:aminomethyltransferase|nr:glycine cleavage system aminomethyltransferase GcvT [Burkholderiales bacterium]